MTAPLDWPALVEEAILRRRAEGLTKKEHAALAGVSRPTLARFDRLDMRLSLANAYEILDVVGLAARSSHGEDQERFVHRSKARWQGLIEGLPENAPARFPDGWFAIDYRIDGVEIATPKKLLTVLGSADRKYTGWPPFWMPKQAAIAPSPVEDGIECWMGSPKAERAFGDAAHSDFWRASLTGSVYLQRGYQEDCADGLSPATIFDLTLPIWRVGEVFLHAQHYCEALGLPAETGIELNVRYTGLAGRELKSWANAHRVLDDDRRARVPEAIGHVTISLGDVSNDLPVVVAAALQNLYLAFDLFAPPQSLFVEELRSLRRSPRR
ncbi:MAG: helix-turn-helix transcriptional regulator [Alphaproteobacteria bacterium]|jgi:transcriptional regulator with XRE-family HTH domain|nr:helix-turn-helix transcriptional regulator [Alphaproteobacteria bacterium]